MTAPSREEFAALVRGDDVDLARACLLIGMEAEPLLEPDLHLGLLDTLAAAVPDPGPDAPPAAAAAALRTGLGRGAGFRGSQEDYGDLRSSLLQDVLRRRRGLPILLSVVWLEVARRRGIPAYGVGLPGHFVVAVGRPGEAPVHVDPYAGGDILSHDAIARRLSGAGFALEEAHLEPWPAPAILLRILTNIRVLTTIPALPAGLEIARTRLWAVELSMLLPHHPAALRQERGELLVQLGDFRAGADELAAYAQAVTPVDPERGERLLRESQLARSRLN